MERSSPIQHKHYQLSAIFIYLHALNQQHTSVNHFFDPFKIIHHITTEASVGQVFADPVEITL